MVWGAISGQGVGPLHRCTGNVNQNVYRAILVGYLTHRQFVQDNAPCHKANLIRGWMIGNDVHAMPWPSCSPDLNPIEQVWAWMKRQIQGKHFANKDALWHELSSLWLRMSPDFVQRFVDSMPRRVKAVIEAKGGVTRY